MATGIICIMIIIVCVLGIRSYTKRLTHGCCGGGQDPVKRVRPADTNIAHYPYIRKIRIGGMTCANCARRVENVYNSMDGVLAEADFAEGCVTVRMKKDYKDIQLKEAVQSAGYFATGIEKL